MAKKKKKIELSDEEKKAKSLESDLNEIRSRINLIPESTYTLQVGDRVRIGAYIDTVVSGVHFDGKAYEITYSTYNTNYGNGFYTHDNKRIVAWTDIRKEVPEDTEVLTKRDDLRLNYSQRSMGDLFTKAYKFGLNLDPEYQREHVWDINDNINLIDSIFNNVDIGKFVYVQLDYNEDYLYEVLDGKQRIRAILDYFEDRFQYKGKFFSELSNRDQSHFEDYPISYAEIRNATQEQKLQYFLKLNTGGRIMDKEHLNKVQEQLVELQKS